MPDKIYPKLIDKENMVYDVKCPDCGDKGCMQFDGELGTCYNCLKNFKWDFNIGKLI